MTRINPYIISIIGLIIGSFSSYLVYSKGLKKFFLFILIGVIMFFYGLMMSFITKPDKIKIQNNKVKEHPLSKWLSECPYCNAKIPNNSIFCPYCGRKLK